MEQRISSIYIIVVAMLFTSLTSNAESIDLISEIQHATVNFYALTDEGTKGEKITRVDISPDIKYVLADIQPEFGYWTNINLLKAPEGLANIGNANSRTRSIENPLGVVGTIEPFGDISPNGSGLYKLGVKTTDGIKWIVMDGIVTEQISLDEEEFNINGTDYGLSINDRNPGFIYNGTHQAPSIDEISLVSPYSNSITFDVNANLEVTLRKDGLDIEESISAGTYQLVISGKTNGCFKNSKTFSYWIEKAALTITADDKEKMYGADNPEWTFNYNGFVNDENEEALSRKPTASVTGSDVGTYDIIPKGAEAANYNITYANGTLTITKAPLTIKAGEYTRKQGEENPEFTLEYEGFKNNETETVLTKKPTVTCSATKNSEPGEYEVSVSGAEAQNYEISYVAGKLTVTKADPVTVTAMSYTRVYGEANPEFGYFSEGAALNGTPEITCEATATSPIGTYDIIISQGSVTNYNVTYVKGMLTITKAPLTIKAGEYTRKQGEENPEFTLEYEGFKNNETETVLTKKPTVTCSATKDSEPGEYEVSVSGAEAQNYEISYVAGKMIVTKADPVTVTAMSYTRVYGEGNPEFEFTAEGAALNGTPQITCEATAISPVGTYDIIISQGSVTNNNVTYVKGTLTITKAPLTIRAGEYTRKQGEENPEFTLEYEGFKNNETETVLIKKPTVTCSATKDSEPGEYEVSVSGAEAQNYDISYVTGKLTVEPNNSFDEQGAGYEILDDKSVALSNDANANGEYVVPETVEHDGVIYQVTEIAAEAFKDNTDLTQVTIPASIVSIGENAFAGCTNLQTIVIYSKEPINMSKVRTRASASSAFEGVNQETCVLYVLANCIEEYKNAEGWQDFKNIRPIGDTNGDSVINAADIVEEVNAIMGTPSQKFVRPAADINGDGVVNAADIVAMVNIIMNTQ